MSGPIILHRSRIYGDYGHHTGGSGDYQIVKTPDYSASVPFRSVRLADDSARFPTRSTTGSTSPPGVPPSS